LNKKNFTDSGHSQATGNNFGMLILTRSLSTTMTLKFFQVGT
jgi:hypothetical protein